MALITCNFFSEAIHINTCMNVILPDGAGKEELPALYLLHGYSDNHNAWTRWTSVERYAGEYRLAIVMPDVQKSFYNDFPGINSGYKYWTFVSRELIEVSRNFFRLSHRREDTFVAGLSMGGFGAFKCALNCPEVFSAGASFSGALDPVNDLADYEEKKEIEMILGDPAKAKGGVNDLYAAAQKTAMLAEKPKLYQFCGTDDFLYKGNLKFRDFIGKLGYDYTYAETPGGHEWKLWDGQIEKYLKMLKLEKRKK